MKLICINGCPYAGKDTIGKLIRENIFTKRTASIEKFAAPLHTMAMGMLGLNKEDFYYTLENKKDKKIFYGNAVSLRDVLIQISEGYVKPMLGTKWLSDQAVQQVLIRSHSGKHKAMVFTDCGFQNEFDNFRDNLCGQHDIYLIHIDRQGCSFDSVNDSRETVRDSSNPMLTIQNDLPLPEFKDVMMGNIKQYLGIK